MGATTDSKILLMTTQKQQDDDYQMTEYYIDEASNSHHCHQQWQIIRCPNCKVLITVEELHEYVNANPETKKQAIEEELQLWGEAAYDRSYLIQNVVFCPNCRKVSHFKDWTAHSH
jgi:hypothetical protein